MIASNVIAFDIKKEDRLYRLEMPHGAPLGEACDATLAFYLKMDEHHQEYVKQLKERGAEKSDKIVEIKDVDVEVLDSE